MKINKLKNTVSFAIILGVLLSTISFASALSVYDQNRMLGATSEDWQSTNIREWLNSENAKVDYTALPPSYKNESGFLSNSNFTQSERNGIAVTKHGAGRQSSLGGNTSDTLYLSQRSVAHNDFYFNDKVFLLHYTDLVNYLESNKELMNYNKKYYSNYLQGTTNRKDKYQYVVNSGYYNGGYNNTSVLYTSILNQVNTRDQRNIAPALSLKPEFTISNGVKAKNLTVGTKVSFGKYNGETIEWLVLNKSDAGYPLLWSDKILTIKEYDKEGDINPKTSNYINFNSYDVDIGTKPEIKSWETKGSVKSVPVINIENQSALTTPTNDTKITLKIRATDSNHGVRRIILPNGEVVNGSYAEWTLTENGEYDIIAESNIGIITVRHIVTKAINTPAEVLITTDKKDDSKWTNKPVTVSISSNNAGGYVRVAKGNRNMGYGGSTAPAYPSWIPFGGKKIRVTGTLRNAMTDEEASQVDMNAYIRIRLGAKWYSDSQIGSTWPMIKNVSLKELKQKGEIKIDEIYTVQDNIYNQLYPYLNLMDGNTPYQKSPYNYWMSDFVFEILDKDDLRIEEITFPDNSKKYEENATYVISNKGSYTFSAKDNRGKVTTKTIHLDIDTVKPNIEIIGNDNSFSTTKTLKINATDDTSGIKSIKLPNGEYRTTSSEAQNLSADYNILENGKYTFIAEDYAGNIFSKTITVDTIDKTAPTLTLTKSITTLTNGEVTINASASDSGVGIKSIELPDNTVVDGGSATYTVSSNGSYDFIARDLLDNETKQTIEITNIDKTAPSSPTITNNKEWTNATSVPVTISSGTDSDIDRTEYSLSGATAKSWSIYSGAFNIENEGVTNLTARTIDKAGNISEIITSTVKIDRTAPILILTKTPEDWTNEEIIISASASDVGSGVKSIRLPDNTVVDGSSATYKVSSNGSYEFEVSDLLGNKIKKVINISNVDTVAPIIKNEVISNSWTNKDINLNIDFLDEGSPDSISHRYVITSSDVAPSNGWSAWENSKMLQVKLTEDGEHYVHVEAKDGGNNLSKETYGVYQIDKTPIEKPVLSENDIAFELDAKETVSGVKEVLYKINNDNWTDNVDVSQIMFGKYTISAQIANNAGTKSPVETKEITIGRRFIPIDKKITETKVITTNLLETSDISNIDNREDIEKSSTMIEEAKVSLAPLEMGVSKISLETEINTVEEDVTIIQRKVDTELLVQDLLVNHLDLTNEDLIFEANAKYLEAKGNMHLFSEGKLKANLSKKLDTILKRIKLAEVKYDIKIEKQAEFHVEIAEKLRREPHIQNAKDKVAQLKAGTLKEILEGRISILEESIAKDTPIGERWATLYVELAEALNRPPHIAKAKEVVEKLSPGEVKTALLIRIDAIKGVSSEESKALIEATSYVVSAEKYKYSSSIRKAYEKVNLLEESQDKIDLLERLNLISK